jgi:hypothetical protein
MQRRFLAFLFCFLIGLSVGYGLAYLDHQARVPRLQSTEVFEVLLPDGTSQHTSYAEIDRERAELRQLRNRVANLKERGPLSPPVSTRKPRGAAGREAGALPPPADRKPGSPLAGAGDDSRKKLGDLFAKIFSKPVMQEIVQTQIKRQAGELSAVLDLGDEQRHALEEALTKRKQELSDARGGPGARREEPEPEDLYRTLFSPEQYRRYEEYTARKKELAGASATDRELLEVVWRLDLNQDQETRANEVLKSQWEKIQQLSPMGDPDEETSPLEQFDQYLRKREEIVSAGTQRMKAFLNAEQAAGYARYLQEKDTETRLLQKMIPPESSEGPPPPP